ncbi:MAG TPA: hypothetical protein VGC67_06240 [Cellulomonas sp.]
MPDQSGLTVVWPYGEPDDGKWSEHEAVQLLRRADAALALARCTHDWSSPELAATVDEFLLMRLYDGDRSGGLDGTEESPKPASRWAEGPQARLVLEVTRWVPDGYPVQYLVTTCEADDWRESADAGEDPRASQAFVRKAADRGAGGRLVAPRGPVRGQRAGR